MSPHASASVRETEREVAKLVNLLHDTERRLEDLTGGEVDAVVGESGRPFLLRRAQEELRESDAARQAAILNALPAHIALLDARGDIVSVNAAWRQFARDNGLIGGACGLGLNYLAVCDEAHGAHASEARAAAAGIRGVLAGAPLFSLEYPCHSPTDPRWFLMTVTLLTEARVHGAVVMHLDITARKRADLALRESQATMAAAQHISHFGSWEVDLDEGNNEDANILHWSDEMYRIAGYEPGAVEVTNRFFYSRIPPAEHALIRQGVATAIRDRQPYSLVHRIVRADGSTCLVRETAKIFYDDQTGRPVKIIGTAHDITERARAEAALHESESRYRSLFENMLEGYAYCATLFEGDELRDFVYLEVNGAFEKLTGLTGVVGKKISELIPGIQHSDPDLFALYGRVALTGVAERLETYVIARGGWISVSVYSRDRGSFVAVFDNITERKQTELALRVSEGEQRQLVERLEIETARLVEAQAVANVGSWETDLATLAVVWSDEAHRIFETDPKNFTPTHAEFLARVHPEDREAVERAFDQSLTHTAANALEHRLLLPGDRIKFVEERWRAHRDPQGRATKVFGTCHDITGRRQAESALRESNEKFHQLADNISDAFWIRSPDLSEVQYVSPAFEKIWGRTVKSLHAKPHEWSEFILADDRARVVAAFAALSSEAPSLDIEYRIVRPDGGIRWVRVRGFQIRNAADQLIRHVGIVADITGRKQVETELQWKTAFLEAQVASSIDGILVVDEHGKKTLQNERMGELFDLPEHIAQAEDDSLQLEWVKAATRHPHEFAEKVAELYSHRDAIGRDEIELSNGKTFDRYSAPVVGPGGQYYGRIWTFRDITDRKLSMEALRASEQRFKALFVQAAVGVVQCNAVTGKFVEANQRFCQIVGYSEQHLKDLTFSDLVHARDVGRTREMMERVLAGGGREYSTEQRYRRKDGAEVWTHVTVSAMWLPGAPPDYFLVIVQDITERKRLDEHFLQGQKMEALGQFSGGVAHDFNNILATISGYTELSRMLLKDNTEVRGFLDAVLKASARAADLVKQILTFSRQQPQERHTLQLRPVVEESVKLLRATIPTTIGFDITIAKDAPLVLANANQIHQVLTNLGVNAWHAMRDQPGRLGVVLERWRVDEAQAAAQPRLRPGLHARVTVSDTGSGMDAATLRRIFEPFFTTKLVGEGTGLGLSVVHGIMDGHDGAVTVSSQLGAGSVFQLYFPEHAGEPTAGAIAAGPVPRGTGEAVLVVDDEELIATMLQKTLNRLNYQAEYATDPAAALALVQADPGRFQLVLSDQSMPGMTGLALATRLREIRPDLPVVLMTGFSASLTSDRLAAAGVREVLLKPLTLDLLGAVIHGVLSAQRIL